MATQHSSLRKGWSWILRRPQSTLDVAGNDYATCSLSREIIQEAMPLILSNGKKRAKIFPTNIWKLREMVFSQIIKSRVYWVIIRYASPNSRHQYKYTIFNATSKWKVCIIMIMHVHVWCDFMHFFDTLYQFQLFIWKCWSISA